MPVDINTATLLGIAALNALAAYLGWRTKQTATETKAIAVETHALAEKTELNTNSMREALVIATGDAAHAAGLEQGRTEGEAKAATLAEGVLQGKAKAP